jgi:hypothetical protein
MQQQQKQQQQQHRQTHAQPPLPLLTRPVVQTYCQETGILYSLHSVLQQELLAVRAIRAVQAVQQGPDPWQQAVQAH